MRLCAARGHYVIGFKFGKSLMAVVLDVIASDCVYICDSTNKQDGPKLRFHVNQMARAAWNNSNRSFYVMDFDGFEILHEQTGIARGKLFETLVARHMGGYVVDGDKRFDMTGDIVANGTHYQCKLDNATITTLQTIRNAFHDRHN
jgi:hypothetical protein